MSAHLIRKLPVLILYPCGRCNCRCVMCDIWKSTDARQMSAAELERHARDMEALGVEWVVFSGGEPLMHADLFRFSARLRQWGARTTLLTTGLLLERHAPAVAAGIDDVIVSLDGPPEVHDRIRRVAGAFERLAAGVRALRAVRPDYPVGARCTVQRLNCAHLCATAEAARALGVSWISFLAADVASTAFNRPLGWSPERQEEVALSVDELAGLEREIEVLVRLCAADAQFILETPEKLARIARHFRAHLGLAEPAAPRCNAPWVSAVLEADGTVRPCFFHEPVGRAGERSLAEVLNGPEAMRFRASLDVNSNPVCRRCVCWLYR